LGEFNQCSAQLRQLYTLHNLPGNEDELTAYRILYMIHTLNKRELIELIGSIDNRGPFVQHALKVRSSISTGNYPAFFKLYHTCPNMGSYLIDHFLERERLKTLLKLVKVYRPTLTVKFLAATLGFTLPDEPLTKMSERETLKWIQGLKVPVTNGIIDCKTATAVVAQHVMDLESKGIDIKGQIH
jgi:SAC3 family protein LENG8/THP3